MNKENLSIHSIECVAFDFETTGLNSQSDRVVECAGVKFCGSELRAEFSQLVNPNCRVSPQAQAVSGISEEMLAGKPHMEAVLPQFLAFLGNAVLVAHNANFDMSFLRAECGRLGLLPPANIVVDSCALARSCFPGLPSYSLQNLVQKLGFPSNTAHRALDDSRQCMRLFQACCQELSFMGELSLQEVLNKL